MIFLFGKVLLHQACDQIEKIFHLRIGQSWPDQGHEFIIGKLLQVIGKVDSSVSLSNPNPTRPSYSSTKR